MASKIEDASLDSQILGCRTSNGRESTDSITEDLKWQAVDALEVESI